MSRRPDYGLDAPGVVVRRVAVSIAALVLAVVAVGNGWTVVAIVAAGVGVASTAQAVAMVVFSRRGKLRVRDRVLDLLELEGDEVLLDVGCGRGLMLVGAAKRLPAGEAVGVDVWSSRDQGANTPAGPLHNARLEGVAVRVETADARDLPFDDDTFDVVVSSFVLHNIKSSESRRDAIHEIARVLKPTGRLALADIACTGEYVASLRGLGWKQIERSAPVWRFFPPFRLVLGSELAR